MAVISDLPLSHSKQSMVILEFILLLVIIYPRVENKTKIVETRFWLNLLFFNTPQTLDDFWRKFGELKLEES